MRLVMQRILGHSLAGHVPLGRQLCIGGAMRGLCCRGSLPLRVLAIMSLKYQVVWCTMKALASECVALLCWFIWKLYMWHFLQHDRRWRHMSFSRRFHRLQSEEMSCLDLYNSFSTYPCIVLIFILGASVIHLASQKKLYSLSWKSLLESHFLTYEK